MPGWSTKDERKYEHIKESGQKRGLRTERAKEIAGRTVNKGRREEGKTLSMRSGQRAFHALRWCGSISPS
jgi:hypothetical protein